MTAESISLLTLLPLGHMAVTDLSKRNIHLLTWCCFVLLSIGYLLIDNRWNHLYLDYLMSLCMTLMVVGISLMVVSMRRKIPVRKVVGAGDLLLLIPIVLWFEFLPYLIWFNVTLMSSLLLHLLFQRWQYYAQQKTVPLAGFLSLSLMGYLIIQRLDVL